jgi:valyl-tRNA synthetase
VTASRAALSVVLRLFAPFLPFVTEEVWSWWQSGSVHRASWPTRADLPITGEDPAAAAALEAASTNTAAIRQARSNLKLGFGIPVRLTLTTPASEATWRMIEADVVAGNNVSSATVSWDGAELSAAIEPDTPDA